MKVAFDLDDTLIPISVTFKCGVEKVSFSSGEISGETLRKGAKELLKELSNNHELWIYTTSFRSPDSVKIWFNAFDVQISGFINADIHDEHVKGTSYEKFTKAPKLFGIDCLIDDSKGVELECEEQGIKCIIVDPGDINWADRIRSEILL